MIPLYFGWASLVAPMVKKLPAMWETQVQSWVGSILINISGPAEEKHKLDFKMAFSEVPDYTL